MRRLFLAAGLLLPISRARADTVFLKNGNELEGIVTSQTASKVEIDLGYGTATIPRSDVLKIKRSGKQDQGVPREVQRRMYLSGRKMPREAANLDQKFQEVKRLREAAQDAKTQRALEESQALAARSEISSLKGQYGDLSGRLQAIDPKTDAKGYNAVVDELNKVSGRIAALKDKLEGSPQREREADSAMQNYMSAYGDLKMLLQAQDVSSAKKWEADYYAAVREEIEKMGSDFSLAAAGSESVGNHIIVAALLNGKVRARLLVDTGASTVLLYKRAADPLRLGAEAQLGEVQTRVADGRLVTARAVRLDSVEVGGSVVNGVSAAVVDAESPGFDGLLGMSFLSNFSVKVDAANGKLILERLK